MNLFLKRVLLLSLLMIMTSSCAVKIYTGRDQIEYKSTEISEDVVFTENNVNAKVKWQKNIGTPFFKFPSYLVGITPAISQDGNLYYQNEKSIFAINLVTGDIVSEYEKPFLGSRIVDLERSCFMDDKKIFPIQNFVGEKDGFLIIDDKTRKSDLTPKALETIFCANGKLIEFQEILGFGFSAKDIDSYQRIFTYGKPLSKLYSLDASSGDIILLYSKGQTLYVESHDASTGKLLWQNQYEALQSTDKSLYSVLKFKELYNIERFKEIFVIEITEFIPSSGLLSGRVTSLDTHTGQVNWQVSDIIRVYDKKVGEEDNLFYLSKKDRSDIIYGIDQKTGEEKLRLLLKGHNPAQGIISTADKLFYPGGVSAGNPLLYSTFSAVDKRNGAHLWTLNIDPQLSLPQYDDGVLYFGNRHDFYRNLISGNIHKYKQGFDYYKESDIPLFMAKTAFAVNADTGKILWKLELKGGDKSYIEKIMIKDNMVIIKSFSGWLYAIEWEKSTS